MRVLITGGAGFIGSRLAQRLQSHGHSVAILDNLLHQVHGDRGGPALPGCDVFYGDVRDAGDVARAMRGVDVVHHLAAETGVGQSQYEIGRYVATNTLGMAVVLEAAVAAGVEQVVVASSRAVYGEGRYYCMHCDHSFAANGRRAQDMDAGVWDERCPDCGCPASSQPMAEAIPPAPTSIYGATKWQQEQLAFLVSQTRGLPVTILRFFNIFGPGQSLLNPYVGVLGAFFRRALSGLPIELYEDGRMLRDFVFVEDVATVLQLCTGNEQTFGQTLNVGTGEPVTLMQAADELCFALSLEPRVHISGRYRWGDVRHAVADTSHMEATLGFRPCTRFTEGVRQYAKWAIANQAWAADAVAEDQLAVRNLLRQGKR
jgi:dTDP-L-rhamnose 4-epimerase